MSVTTDTLLSWLQAADDADKSLSERYLSERTDMLNADQVTEVANELWLEYCAAQNGDGTVNDELRERHGEWTYVRGGMAVAEIQLGEASAKVDRFCGGWPFASGKTAGLIAQLVTAAPEGRRP